MMLACIVVAVAASGCRDEMYNQAKAEPLEQSLFFADSQASRPIIEGTVPRGGRVIGAPDAVVRDAAPATGVNAGAVGSQQGASTQLGQSTQQDAAGTRSGAAQGAGQDATRGDASAQSGGADRARSVPTRAATADEIRMMSMPIDVTRAVLERGRERYDVFCSPCHARTGDGDGMIVQRGFPRPPSFHLDRLRTAADGHYYDVITNGFGAMYSYANRVKPDDRWAITAYIRALQLSRSGDTPARPATARTRGGNGATTSAAAGATTPGTVK